MFMFTIVASWNVEIVVLLRVFVIVLRVGVVHEAVLWKLSRFLKKRFHQAR